MNKIQGKSGGEKNLFLSILLMTLQMILRTNSVTGAFQEGILHVLKGSGPAGQLQGAELQGFCFRALSL